MKGVVRCVVLALLLVGCGDGGGDDNPPPNCTTGAVVCSAGFQCNFATRACEPVPSCVTGAVICPNGFQCSLATRDCEQANGALRWQLTDGCADGLRIQVRFFDTTHSGHWPAEAGQAWITPAEGGFVDESLACIPGATVCYGATPFPQDGSYWGLGIDGDQGCTDCCVTCGGGNPPPINLTCT